MTIRLVLFDALHTLVRPRAPVFVQYAAVFEPHLGKLSPDAIKSSFKSGETPKRKRVQKSSLSVFFSYLYVCTREALTQVQIERPAYASGAPEWWGEVIKRTALGAGADPTREYSVPSLALFGGLAHVSPSSFVHLRGLINIFVRFGSHPSPGSVYARDRTHIAYKVLLGTGLHVVY